MSPSIATESVPVLPEHIAAPSSAPEPARPPNGFNVPTEDSGLGFVDPHKHMTVKHHFIGGIYTKECHLPVGYWFGQHRHSFDHQSVLVSGTAIVEVDGVRTEHTGPAVLTIKARKHHTLIPLTPVVWLCQHVTSCTDPDDIDIEFIDREHAAEGV